MSDHSNSYDNMSSLLKRLFPAYFKEKHQQPENGYGSLSQEVAEQLAEEFHRDIEDSQRT